MTSTPGSAPEELVAGLEAAARAVAGFDWGTATATQLALVERIVAAEAVLGFAKVAIAGRLAVGETAAELGWASAKDLLTAVSGGHKGTGPGLVKLAERLASMPATATALAAGWLSMAKAQVIAAKVDSLPYDTALRAAAEADLLGAARSLDATELARTWPSVLDRIDPESLSRFLCKGPVGVHRWGSIRSG